MITLSYHDVNGMICWSKTKRSHLCTYHINNRYLIFSEELEKQRAALHYQKLHAEGKTEEARSDLARLAIIKQQREEAARKREVEKKGIKLFSSW